MGDDNAFRCAVTPEKSSGTLVIRRKKHSVCVLNMSRIGFTILISEDQVPKLEDRRVYRLLFDGETCEVVKQSHYSADGQVSVGLQRLARVRKHRSRSRRRSSRRSTSSKRSFFTKLPSKADPTSAVYLAMVLLIALIVLPGVGDRLGTAAGFRDGVQMFWNTSLAMVSRIMHGGSGSGSGTRRNVDAIHSASNTLGQVPTSSDSLSLGFFQTGEWSLEGNRSASNAGSYATSSIGAPEFAPQLSFLLPSERSLSPNTVSPTALGSKASDGSRFVQELRSRDWSGHHWAALMLDSIPVNQSRVALIAVGIDEAGSKHVLDFCVSGSRASASASSMLFRIHKRGFDSRGRLFVVIGTHPALRPAVKSSFPASVVQHCIADVERDTKAKLTPRDWSPLHQHFRTLRTARGIDAAKEAFEDLHGFVEAHEPRAARTLQAARSELLTLHRLGVPAVLQRTLLSTEQVDQALLLVQSGGELQLPLEKSQAENSLACALLEAEKHFAKIEGARQLHHLVDALAGN